MIAANEQKWDVDFLNSMSLKTDPYAEQVITDIIADKGFAELRNLFTSLSNDHDEIVNNPKLSKAVIDYFNAELALPLWANTEKINLAEKTFARYAPQIAMLLNFKALPLCYACKNGAKVLAATGRLVESKNNVARAARRLFETSQMVINVMSPQGLTPKGTGIVTVKKVRLYHAAIRMFLQHPHKGQEPWDVNKYGAPINQEEMAGTLMAFSALVIDGLAQVGGELTEEQKDAFIHCWNIVGHFIGLDPSLYPTNYQSGWNLGIQIISKNKDESPEGKELTKTLIDFSATFFGTSKIQQWLFKGLPQYFVLHFIQDVSKTIDADLLVLLGVTNKQSKFTKLKGRFFVKAITWVSTEEHKNKLFRSLYAKLTTKVLQGMIDSHLHTYNTAFYIPDSLKQSWKMN